MATRDRKGCSRKSVYDPGSVADLVAYEWVEKKYLFVANRLLSEHSGFGPEVSIVLTSL